MSSDSDARREEAIDRVERNANEEWMEAAVAAGIRLAECTDSLVSEDIFTLLNEFPVGTHEPRAMGAVMRRLRKDGFIEPTDTFIKSPSPVGHGRPSRVWRSRVCRAAVSHA